jgi:hypothetical protein
MQLLQVLHQLSSAYESAVAMRACSNLCAAWLTLNWFPCEAGTPC